MFDISSSRQFADASSPRIVASCQERQAVEARQRDIYDSHRHRTFALAYYMTGNEVEAEQILTSTFIRAFKTVQEPEGRDVDSALLEELRQRSHLEPELTLSQTPLNRLDFDAELVVRNVKRTDLEEAMWSVSPVERLLFLFRDVEGYTPAAIAQLLNMPEPEVQRGLFSARLRLRRILADVQTGEEPKAA